MAKITVNNPKNVINSKIGKNYFKLVGTGGPKGDKGDKGDTGTAATISAGTASSLPAGSSPTVTNSGTSSAAVFNFGIPKGDKGDKGDTGATGAAATITVGSTTTGAAGTNASVTNTGTSGAAVLNFTIPRGDKGETGATGATGATGQAATIAVGSTTTLAPGSSATVTNSGTSSAATFNFGIPQGVKGDTGSVKSAYVTSLPSTGNEDTYYLNGDTATTGSVSGTAVQITNADNTGEISDFKLNGNATQTTYSGKNLCYETRLNGTNNILFFIDKPASNTITFSATINVATSGNSIYLRVDDLDKGLAGTIIGGANTRQTSTLTLSDTQMEAIKNGRIVYLMLYKNNAGFTLPTDAQVENGSELSAYEPYVGGTASPNPDYPQPISVVTGENVVKITGKNLLELQDSTNTSAGVNFAVNNGTITASGTTTKGSYAETDSIIPTLAAVGNYPAYVNITEANSLKLPAGTYTLSAEITKSGNVAVGLAIGVGVVGARPTTSLKLEVGINTANGTYTRTATVSVAEGQRIYPSVWYEGSSTNKTVGLSITNIQLELGSTATSYEPYQGQEYQIDLSSKNLFDKNAVITGKILERADGTLRDNPSYAVSDFIPVKEGEKYTYTGFNYWYACYYNADKTFHSTPANYATITIPTGVAYVRCSLLQTNLDTAQFEHGTQATSYAEFYNYELAKIGTYQDRIYKNDGKWYVEKQIGKVVLDGTETWTKGSNANGLTYFYTLKSDKALGNDIISNLFSNIATWTVQTNINAINGSGGNTAINIMLANTSISSADAFKTWLGTHNTTVYYALATPTDTAITESALITPLDNLVSAELLSGVNNIMLVPANQPNGSMSIDYTTWDKHDRYDVYIWNDTIGDYQLIHAGGGNN